MCHLAVAAFVHTVPMVPTVRNPVGARMKAIARASMDLASVLLGGEGHAVQLHVNKVYTVRCVHNNVHVRMVVGAITSVAHAHVQLVGWEMTAVSLVR